MVKFVRKYRSGKGSQPILKTRTDAKQAIFENIEVSFYNRERIHSANDVCHPEDYETQHKTV